MLYVYCIITDHQLEQLNIACLECEKILLIWHFGIFICQGVGYILWNSGIEKLWLKYQFQTSSLYVIYLSPLHILYNISVLSCIIMQEFWIPFNF